MYKNETGYQQLLLDVLTNGDSRPDRTGTGTLSMFGQQITFEDIENHFPLFTSRKIFTKGVIGELCGFLRGAMSTQELEAFGCNYWNAWALDCHEDNLGPIYGAQWRNFNGDGTDQIAELVSNLKTDPYLRRHLVSCWNPVELDDMALPPCFDSFQVYVAKGALHMIVRMRSSDLAVGLPSDVMFHALLLKLLANEINLESGNLTFWLGDTHIYNNNLEQARLIASRELYPPCTVTIEDVLTVEVEPSDITIKNYEHGPRVPLELAL